MATVEDLESWIDESLRRSARKGYPATRFRQMRERYNDIVKVITMLVESGEIQSGFRELKRLGLEEWSVEAAVINFSDLFKPRTFECAEWRRRQIGG